MLLRNGFLGLLGLAAGAGLAVAASAPPINPHIEGREPNPVIREFHETEKPVTEYGAEPVIPARSKIEPEVAFAGWSGIVIDAWKMLLEMLSGEHS